MTTFTEDEEVALGVAKYIAEHGLYEPPIYRELTNEEFDSICKEIGYINGPRLVSYLKTPEGRAFLTEKVETERQALAEIPPEEDLSQEERERVIGEFKEIMGREPTESERKELIAQELRLREAI